MTNTLLSRASPRFHLSADQTVTPAQWLRETTAAVRVSFTWFGVRKALTTEQKSRAAESFGAEGDYLSARKKLLDTKHPAYQEVTGVRGRAKAFWKSVTLPFPEAGIRLIRQHEIERFNAQMEGYRTELEQTVRKLDEQFTELKLAARQRLGALFNPSDYPSSLEGMFAVEWDFPNVEAPDYLSKLSPDLYEQERQRVAGRFEEAVKLTEQAFIGEFGKLIEHLTERLSDNGIGEKKIFRDSALTNLVEFFDRFRQLNIRSNADLDALVDQAQQVVKGTNAQTLRDSNDLRQHVAAQLSRVQTELDGMLVDRPRRRIIRNPPVQ
jgi:hypothetical protein